MKGQIHEAFLFVTPATLLFLSFIVYGIAYKIYNSLEGQTFYGTSVFVGLHHFVSMMQDPIFWQALRNITIPAIVLYLALQNQLEKGVQGGALKG